MVVCLLSLQNPHGDPTLRGWCKGDKGCVLQHLQIKLKPINSVQDKQTQALRKQHANVQLVWRIMGHFSLKWQIF